MKKFHFPLARVREWRENQVAIEETRLERLVAELVSLDARRDALTQEREQEEKAVLLGPLMDAQSLCALERYRGHNRRAVAKLVQERADCELRMAVQRTAVLEAQRKVKLLDKLEHRRRLVWTRAFDRELEEQAAESHRSRLFSEGREAPG